MKILSLLYSDTKSDFAYSLGPSTQRNKGAAFTGFASQSADATTEDTGGFVDVAVVAGLAVDVVEVERVITIGFVVSGA